jgi:arsenate reductase
VLRADASCTVEARSEVLRMTYNVLFLCTGNSARSILAEALVNRCGAGELQGFSAGSHPKGKVHPLALELLEQMKFPIDKLRSKSWDEFSGPDAPVLDFIFTVCDNAAGETCPVWLGHPMTAHWGISDPAAVEGSDADQRTAFREAFDALEKRIKAFVDLPLASLDQPTLMKRLNEIGRI